MKEVGVKQPSILSNISMDFPYLCIFSQESNVVMFVLGFSFLGVFLVILVFALLFL